MYLTLYWVRTNVVCLIENDDRLLGNLARYHLGNLGVQQVRKAVHNHVGVRDLHKMS